MQPNRFPNDSKDSPVIRTPALGDMGSSPCSVTSDCGQITNSVCMSVSPSVKWGQWHFQISPGVVRVRGSNALVTGAIRALKTDPYFTEFSQF